MDLQYPARNIHLPQELVDCIASHLRKATDITAARLVSRSFCDAATKLMLDIQCSPSELFTLPTRMELDEIDHAAPKFFKWFDRRAEQLVTQWTWLEIPCEITLEDRYTEHGRKFLELAIAPSTDACRDSLDDEELDDGKDDVPLSSGRKATCWGRMQEKPGLFCIVMRACLVFDFRDDVRLELTWPHRMAQSHALERLPGQPKRRRSSPVPRRRCAWLCGDVCQRGGSSAA